MKLSDKQMLLSYFKDKKEREITTVCDITGISFQIKAPFIPSVKGHVYSGLSPLANKEAAENLALCKYSEAHYDLSSSVMAGTLLSLFHHYKLREDKLSAIEANMILSQLPLFFLSSVCNFVVNLSDWELKRIPHLSLYDSEASILKSWYLDCRRVLDISDYAPLESKPQPKLKTSYIDNSIVKEDRKEARALLKDLKTNCILPLKLQTIVSMSIQKNNLAMISPELRKNIVAGLEKLGTPECLSLAKIFVRTGKNLTQQETIIAKSFEESASTFSSISNAPSTKLTLAEIIAQKKQQATQKPMNEALSLIAEIEAEGQSESFLEDSNEDTEEEFVEEEFLLDTESDEAIMEAAGISELDLDSDDLVSNQDLSDQENSLDLDSLFDSEGEQNEALN